MQTTKTVFALLLVSCALAQESRPPQVQPRSAETQRSSHFPMPRSGLSLNRDGEGDGSQTLAGMLAEFCRVTGQNFSVSEAARQMLQATATGLVQPVDVPPAQVYPFVEALLIDRGFVITELRAQEPRLLALHLTRSNDPSDRSRARERCVLVPAERIAEYADHPALMVRTVIDVSPLDARLVANTLRGVIRDSELQNILPIGGVTSLLVEGPGAWVASVAEMLRDAAEIEREWLEKNKPAPEDARSAVPEQR